MKLKKENVKHSLLLDLKEVIGNTYILTDCRPFFAYKDGVKGNQEGFIYEIVLIDKTYEKIGVRIKGDSKLDIAKHKNKKVEFDGLKPIIYPKAKDGGSFAYIEFNLNLQAENIKISKENTNEKI